MGLNVHRQSKKKLYLVYSAIGALVVSGVNRGGQRTEMKQEGKGDMV